MTGKKSGCRAGFLSSGRRGVFRCVCFFRIPRRNPWDIMGLPCMPTLTPSQPPQYRHIWQSHGVSGIFDTRSLVRGVSLCDQSTSAPFLGSDREVRPKKKRDHLSVPGVSFLFKGRPINSQLCCLAQCPRKTRPFIRWACRSFPGLGGAWQLVPHFGEMRTSHLEIQRHQSPR